MLNTRSELRAVLNWMVKNNEISPLIRKNFLRALKDIPDNQMITREQIQLACEVCMLWDWEEKIWSRLNEQE